VDLSEEMVDCPWCGQATRPEPLHGHYVCTSCRRPVADCCDGELENEEHGEKRGDVK